MHPTQYKNLTSITRNTSSLAGGICKWWYTPIQNIASFPAINPVTQMLATQPILKAGTTWFGPVNIPKQRTGWKQTQDTAKPGKFYKHVVEGYVPGLDSDSQINLDNLSHHHICIVAKLRSGGHYIVLGNKETGCQYDDELNTGIASMDTPGTQFFYTWESIDKALVLASFNP